MRHSNKKGFFLVEVIAAFVVLIALMGIIAFYTATSAQHIQKAKSYLKILRLVQQALAGFNSDGSIKVDTKPFFCSSYDLQGRGYTTKFHEKLLVKSVAALCSDQENTDKRFPIELMTIHLTENTR